MIETRTVRTPWGNTAVEVATCDNCQGESLKDLAVGWIEMDKLGIDISTMGSVTALLPYHLCSVRCVREFVANWPET